MVTIPPPPRGRFLIKINLFFSGLRLRGLSGAARGEQGAEFKGNHQVATFKAVDTNLKYFVARWKQEKVENGEMDISDNNNTNEKNKNGMLFADGQILRRKPVNHTHH